MEKSKIQSTMEDEWGDYNVLRISLSNQVERKQKIGLVVFGIIWVVWSLLMLISIAVEVHTISLGDGNPWLFTIFLLVFPVIFFQMRYFSPLNKIEGALAMVFPTHEFFSNNAPILNRYLEAALKIL